MQKVKKKKGIWQALRKWAKEWKRIVKGDVASVKKYNNASSKKESKQYIKLYWSEPKIEGTLLKAKVVSVKKC